ncbi:MAG TPA: LptA/OstA family protein [Dongiaceae bacterium]|jgi:lipopolysaccharide export system protein LptA|nr:LptA/OstA family protein [Dongiaceae bacterium]
MSPMGVITESPPSAPFLRAAAPRIVGAISIALFLVLAAPVSAQEANGQSTTSGGGGVGFDNNKKDPIEISAENGIEWKRDARTYTARGNALAQQGGTSIAADTLIAYLDENDDISHWEGIGNVKIQTSQSTSYGDHADYQESSRLLVLTGRNLKVVTNQQTVTARDRIEYWRDKDIVVAKGNVVIVRPQKNTTIHSDEATAFFRDKVDNPATPEDESADGSEVYQVEAQGHVRVDRKDQTGFSNHLAYDPDTDIAILTGNVVINSKDNTYRGGRAELDMKNDISRLLPAQGQRVFTTIKPKDNEATTGTNTQPAPVTQ